MGPILCAVTRFTFQTKFLETCVAHDGIHSTERGFDRSALRDDEGFIYEVEALSQCRTLDNASPAQWLWGSIRIRLIPFRKHHGTSNPPSPVSKRKVGPANNVDFCITEWIFKNLSRQTLFSRCDRRFYFGNCYRRDSAVHF